MSKPILSSELYSNEGHIRKGTQELIEMKTAFEELRAAVVKDAEELSSSIKKANIAIEAQRGEFNKNATAVDTLSKKFEKYNSAIRDIDKEVTKLKAVEEELAKATTQLNNSFDESDDSIKSLKKQLKGLVSEYDSLSRAERKSGDDGDRLRGKIAKLKSEIDLETKARREAANVIKLQTIVANTQEGTYDNLSAKYRLLAIELNKMTAQEIEGTKAGRDMETQAKATYNEMKRLQEARGKHTLSVGNYAGAITGAITKQQNLVNQLKRTGDEFKRLPINVRNSAKAQEYHAKVVSDLRKQIESLESITGRQLEANTKAVKSNNRLVASLRNMAAVYFSVSRAGEFFNRVFADTKKLDSLNLAYEKTIPNLKENAEVQQFLSETAEKYGTNILVLQKAYLRFNAASASSNLSMKEQQKIFNSVAKASAVLGLEASKTDRVFNALEQILSKGTVSAEELRQQLGDSLPGSMEIMAKALGVTTFELGKMIENGEVLAEDALPKFAAQLEKAYGIEQVEKVDNLAAAQGRFETAVVDLIEKLDTSKAFKEFFSVLAEGVVYIKDNLEAIFSLGKAVAIAAGAYATYRTGIIAATTATNLFNIAMRNTSKGLAVNPIGILAVVAASAALVVINLADAMGRVFDVQKELNKVSKEYQSTLSQEKAEMSNLLSIVTDANVPLDERKVIYDKLQKLYPSYLDNIDLENTSLEQLAATQGVLNKAIEQNLALKIQGDKIEESRAREVEAKSKIIELRATKGANLGLLDIYANDDNLRSSKSAREEAVENIIKQQQGLIEKEKEYQAEIRKTYGELARGETRADRIRLAGIRGLGGASANVTTGGKKKANSKGTASTRSALDNQLLLANALEDGYEKELELLRISNEKKIVEFKKYGLDTSLLVGKYASDRQKIIDKYNKEELDKADDLEQQRIDLIENSTEQKIAQLEFDTERYARHTDDKLEIDEFYARGYAKIQKKIDAEELARLKQAESDRKAAYQDSLADFQLSQEIDRANRSNTGQTPLDDKKFDVKQEAKLIKFQLDTDEDLTDSERELLDAKLRALFREYDELLESRNDDRDIYDMLGIKVDDKTKDALKTAIDFAKEQWSNFAKLRKEVADQNVEQANREVTSAESALQVQIDARNNNYAHSVTTAEAELLRAKKVQDEALKEQKAAQKEQQAIQSLEQVSNLATASTKIFQQVGNPFISIPLIGLMFGAYIGAKVRANSLVKEYAEGTYEEFDHGGSHKSGNDISLSHTKDGKERRVERGESMMILPKKATSQYKAILPKLFKELKAGTFQPEGVDLSNDSNVNYWTSTTEVNNDGLISYFETRDSRDRLKKRSTYSNGVEIVTRGSNKTYIYD